MSMHKLPESELKVLEYIWSEEKTTAKDTAAYMAERFGWKKNTTYTVLKNLNEKGIIERIEPGFKVIPLIKRMDVAREEANTLLDRFYDGSVSGLFSAFLKENKISQKEMKELKELFEKE